MNKYIYIYICKVGTTIALVVKFTVKSNGRQGVFVFALYTFRLARILRLARRAKVTDDDAHNTYVYMNE
jgi:hypothetical protein